MAGTKSGGKYIKRVSSRFIDGRCVVASSRKTLATAQADDLQTLLAERVEGGYKATSSARLLSAMRRFFQHLYREKYREDDPSAQLASPKLPQRLPKDLSEAQVERLLQAPLIDQPLELRDKAMLEVLYATGLRVSELVGLTMSDISLRQGMVRVIGKGNKERLVPLGEEAVYWLETYLEHGRPRLPMAYRLTYYSPASVRSR